MTKKELKKLYLRWEAKQEPKEPEPQTLCDIYPDVPIYDLQDNKCLQEVDNVRL